MNRKIVFDWRYNDTYDVTVRENRLMEVVRIYHHPFNKRYLTAFHISAISKDSDEFVSLMCKYKYGLQSKDFDTLQEAKDYADTTLKMMGCVFASNKAKLLL